ncbi:MAG: hypothetical protein IT497_05090 [Ottowia sp.]|nr:hypothetical protein [Ottowia sp.]
MHLNTKGSENIAILATLEPANQAVGTMVTNWVSLAHFHAVMAVIETGVMGTAATIDAKLQQALDTSGAGVKDIPGKRITQLTQAGNGSNKQAIINFRAEELDTTGGFLWVRLALIISGASSLVAAKIWGITPRYHPADTFNQAGVVQII